MSPWLRPGDEIGVTAFGAPPRSGEIVVWRDPSSGMFVHRVLGRSASGALRVAGDFDRTPRVISNDQVIGKVVERTRQGATVRLDGTWARLAGRVWRRGVSVPIARWRDAGL